MSHMRSKFKGWHNLFVMVEKKNLYGFENTWREGHKFTVALDKLSKAEREFLTSLQEALKIIDPDDPKKFNALKFTDRLLWKKWYTESVPKRKYPTFNVVVLAANGFLYEGLSKSKGGNSFGSCKGKIKAAKDAPLVALIARSQGELLRY